MEKNSKNQNQSMVAQTQQNTVRHNAYQDQRNPGQNQPYVGQYQPNAGHYQPYAGQSQPNAGQYQPYAGQNQPNAGQYQPYAGQNQPNAGQYQQNLRQFQQNAGQYQQKQKKINKIFQKKIILGSVCGFIATVIGTIAVFFPSLFNLEIKKIEELKITISTPSDAWQLYDFLIKNQNKIISLEIQYLPKVEVVHSEETAPKVEPGHAYHNMIDTNMFELYYEYPYLEDVVSGSNRGIYYEERVQNVLFGEELNFSVANNLTFDYSPAVQKMENGTFTFILDDTKKPIKVGTLNYNFNNLGMFKIKFFQKPGTVINDNVKNIDEYIEKYVYDEDLEPIEKNSFSMVLPFSSNNQTLYQWQCHVLGAEPATLKGTFLVHPLADSIDLGEKTASANTSILSGGRLIRTSPYNTALPFVHKIIKIEPMDQKALTIKNY